MAVLLGSSDPTQFTVTTNTYSSGSGECFYSVIAPSSGSVDTLKIRMNTFNTTTQIALRVRSSTGLLLSQGIIATPAQTGERSVSVNPFNVVKDESYIISIVANTGSPQPFQSASQGINNQSASTFASPQDPLVLPGNTLGAVRKFHMWAEGIATITLAISVSGSTAPGVKKTWAATGFSPDPNIAIIDGIECPADIDGFTPPAIVDEQPAPRPGVRTLTGSNGTQTANTTATVGVFEGYSYVALNGVLETGNNSVIQSFNPPAVSGADFLIIPPGSSSTEQGLPSSNNDGEEIWWHVEGATKIHRMYVVTFGEGGEFTVTRFAKPLIAKKLTAKSLMAKKL